MTLNRSLRKISMEIPGIQTVSRDDGRSNHVEKRHALGVNQEINNFKAHASDYDSSWFLMIYDMIGTQLNILLFSPIAITDKKIF